MVINVTRVQDDGHFTARDGEYRLAGLIQSPEARGRTAQILSQGEVRLTGVGVADRYGRRASQVFAAGVWVQDALLRKGLARYAPDSASAPCAARLLAAEDFARKNRAGLWRGVFRVLGEGELRARMSSLAGSFQIIEGTIMSAAITGGRGYLNFGADRKSDFTVMIAPADMKLFRKEKLDIRTWTGARVRVRGWIELFNGPEIVAARPENIELLTPVAKPVKAKVMKKPRAKAKAKKAKSAKTTATKRAKAPKSKRPGKSRAAAKPKTKT